MTLEDKIKPFNPDHSIKEVVISLFLASPIVKPERFKALIDKASNNFQLFEPLLQVQVQILNQTPGQTPDFFNKVYNDAGFKLTAFEKGQPSKILQGLNDIGNGRNYISYHTLKYTRWNPFFDEYIKIISSVSELSSDIFLTAISLHYVDQFQWIFKDPIDLTVLFNKDAAFVPKEFFNAAVSNYTIVTEKQVDEKRKYLDRLEITIDNLVQRIITISHNVTQPLSEVISLENLIVGQEFRQILNDAHLHNKNILKDLLTVPATNMIKLQ